MTLLCLVLGVSRAGFYAWRKRPASARQRRDEELATHIAIVHDASRETYGSPRVLKELRASGERVGRKRVARLMQEYGMRARQRRRFVRTTDSKHSFPIAPNILDRKFQPAEPNKAWATDITYIPTRQGWLYLAVVMDLFSRRIIGWSMRDTIDTKLVSAAFDMATQLRRCAPGVIHHSDRGCQYASHEYRAKLEQTAFVASMSRTGNCWDNACVESFFSSLKTELVHRADFASHEEARQQLFDYIEVFYNRRRRHSTLGYVSPADYEMRFTKAVAA